MGFTLNIDTKEVKAKFDNAKDTMTGKLLNELNRWALKTAGDAKRNCPVDEGFLRNSIAPVTATPEKLTASVIAAANYAPYVEFGTRSFAAAYVATLPATWQAYAASFKGKSGGSYADFILRLVGWLKRKGIPEGAAYPIARKILRTGLRPRPFLYPAVTKNFAELLKRIK